MRRASVSGRHAGGVVVRGHARQGQPAAGKREGAQVAAPRVDAGADVEVTPVVANEVRNQHRVAVELVRPAERRLTRVRHLEPRIQPLANQRQRIGIGSVLAGNVRDRLTESVEAAIGIANYIEFLDAMHRARIKGALVGVEAVTPEGLKDIYKDFNQSGESLVVMISMSDRELRMKVDPETFFITDHYLNYPAMLVRLATVREEDLRELLEEAWRRVAPPDLLENQP